MNDLEYRRNQLLKLQETVIDLEDLSSGVAITDLTLTDFRIDLAEFVKAHPGKLESLPLGCFAVTTSIDAEISLASFFACGQRMRRLKKPSIPATPLRRITWCTWGRTAPCCCPTRKPSASWIGSSA